jgi:hypothetical protein
VTPQGWKDFADRLAVASEVLKRAADLEPGNPDPPTYLLTVALGQGWSRDELDKWYQRALDADPDNYAAAEAVRYYLEPKWYGSPDEMIAFGRSCFETRNWHGNMAFMLVDAHIALAKESTNTEAYYRDAKVWADLSSVYIAYLQVYPKDDEVRSKYAYYACQCQQWTTANELFKQLGDNADDDVFGGKEKLQQMKADAAKKI